MHEDRCYKAAVVTIGIIYRAYKVLPLERMFLTPKFNIPCFCTTYPLQLLVDKGRT